MVLATSSELSSALSTLDSDITEEVVESTPTKVNDLDSHNSKGMSKYTTSLLKSQEVTCLKSICIYI